MSHSGSKTVIIKALVANLGIAAAKFGGAFYSGSASLLAEAIHSLVDSTNQVLLLVGASKSSKPPTDKHPLGFGREAFFWSFVVAILLFSLGGLFAIYEGVHKFSDTAELSHPSLGLGILLASLLLEGWSFSAALKEVRSHNRYPSLWQWFRHSTSSELLVVFTEDLAALLGLAIATVCLLLAWTTGNSQWDAVGSIFVGIVLVITAILLASEIKSLIIGESPATEYRSAAEMVLKNFFPDGKLLNLIALQTGANEVMLSYKFNPGNETSVPGLIEKMNLVEQQMKMRFPEIRWQFMEPDNED